MIHFVIVAFLVAVSTYGLYTFVLTNEILLPFQASEQAVFIDGLFSVHWFFIAFFYSLIVVFVLYSVVVFRRRPGDESDGEHFEGNTKLEIVWTVIPLIIVMGLSFAGAQTLADVERRDPQAIEVNVVASQWNWRFEYPDYGIITNELVLPKDQQILLHMRSEDVIHSFWVPEFRVKQDVLPGDEDFTRDLRVTPNEYGEYRLRCAELCGQLHYNMLADVRVVSVSEFAGWAEIAAADCEADDVTCGEKWATQFGCVACHSQDGTVIVGPTWSGLADSTVTLADGSTVLADADYLVNSILEPNAQVHEGFSEGIMPPNFAESLTTEQIDQLVAFIQSLK